MEVNLIHILISWKNDPSGKSRYYYNLCSNSKPSELHALILQELYIPVEYQVLTCNGISLQSYPALQIGSIFKLCDVPENNMLELTLENTRPYSNTTIEFTVILTHGCKYGSNLTRFGVIIHEHARFCELSDYLQETWSFEDKSLLYLLGGKYYNYNSTQPVSTILDERMMLYLAILDTSHPPISD